MEFNRIMGADEAAVWARFWLSQNDANRNALVQLYLPLVDLVLRGFRSVRSEDRHDLRGAGHYGLLRAVDSWNPAKMLWLDFVKLKIRYAMVDQIREMSWVPKGVRQKARKIDEAEDMLTADLGRTPTRAELAALLAMTEEECEAQIASFRATDWSVTSLEGRGDLDATWYETLEDPAAPDPERCSLWGETVDDLELVLQRLPELDRQLIYWKYFTQPRVAQKWMAQQLGVHESRVSQLLDAAIEKARKIAEHPDVLFPELYQSEGRFTSRD